MDTSTIYMLVVFFLVSITFARRQMLKEKVEKPERRNEIRRQDKRRAHTGRRVHEFNAGCDTENRRNNEDRREGEKERRRKDRRHKRVSTAV